MVKSRRFAGPALSFALILLSTSAALGQINIGDYTVSGSAEVGGLPRTFSGDKAKFEEYRDVPESVIVPQLQMMIGGKKEDFYLNVDAVKVGRNDQNYTLRFGRYGLLDVQFEWDQIPHRFSEGVARTPYISSNNGGLLTLPSRPNPLIAPNNCAVSTSVCGWVNSTAQPIDLSLYNGIARVNVKYTPTPGWTFTGGYWSNHNVGERAFGALFGPSPGSYNITELVEPINYQTNNVELGAEYAGNGWTLALKYNGSYFHNSVSTLIWDNPIHTTLGGGCIDSAAYNGATGTGPCRGRLDLYPSNQAHTFALTGTAQLPWKTRFLSTISYGWRLQDDSFLPFTNNRCFTSDPTLVGTTDATRCTTALRAMPSINSGSLDGNVQPLMINATLVNNAVDRLNLKAYYRFYNLDNNSKGVSFNQGIIVNDQAPAGCPPACPDAGTRSIPYQYSTQNLGMEAGYDFARWISTKLVYNWQRKHTSDQDVLTSDEFTIGPTIDVKPTNWTLFRLAYRHSWRNAPDYNNNRVEEVDIANISRKFYLAKRDRDKVSLYSEISPWERVSFHAGFEFTGESFLDSTLGTQNDFNYSPSVGVLYTPADWVKLFANYNFDIYSWRLDAMQRSSTAQNPNDPNPPSNCNADCVRRLWTSRGKDTSHTFSIGSDLDIIRNLLGFRIQYTFSQGLSQVNASGATCTGCTRATDYPNITNTWQELLARFEYQLYKNVALNFGYYFNRFKQKDYGVDIMKPWMGDVDTGVNVQRSIFLGDKNKGNFTANVGFLTVKLKF
jgi:MtrB/PioB family decaheme-associated outer membrane protein